VFEFFLISIENVNYGNAVMCSSCIVATCRCQGRCCVTSNNTAYLGLHVKFPIFLSDFKQIGFFLDGLSTKSAIRNLTKISAVGAELYLRPDGRIRESQ